MERTKKVYGGPTLVETDDVAEANRLCDEENYRVLGLRHSNGKYALQKRRNP